MLQQNLMTPLKYHELYGAEEHVMLNVGRSRNRHKQELMYGLMFLFLQSKMLFPLSHRPPLIKIYPSTFSSISRYIILPSAIFNTSIYTVDEV